MQHVTTEYILHITETQAGGFTDVRFSFVMNVQCKLLPASLFFKLFGSYSFSEFLHRYMMFPLSIFCCLFLSLNPDEAKKGFPKEIFLKEPPYCVYIFFSLNKIGRGISRLFSNISIYLSITFISFHYDCLNSLIPSLLNIKY